MNEPAAAAAKLGSEAGAAAIALKHASRLYGSFVALRDVSLTLEAGASVVLLGENGAGKSTLLKLVSGLAQPSYGSVRVFGEPPLQRRGSIGTMGHQPMLYDDLTGTENLMYFAALHGLATRRSDLQAIAAAALKDVALEPGLKRRVGEYSQGMRQRASLARVLMTEPELLLLDEPFSNLDVASGRAMVERLLRWTADRRSRTLLLTTHQAELARPLARTTITLHSGSVASVAEVGAR